jgi:LCP family protein required for cell wall assembly
MSLGAVALSLLIPGAGHLLIGRRRRALVFFAIDAVILMVAAWLLSLGTLGVLKLLVQPRWVRGVVAVNVAVGLFRVAAAIDVALIVRPRVDRLVGTLAVGTFLGLLLIPHMFVMTRALSLLGVLEDVFPSEGHIAAAFELRRLEVEQARAEGSQGPVSGETTTTSVALNPDLPDGSVVPRFDDPGAPDLEDIDLNRVTVLLAGGDAGPGRGGLRTDTMIVASLDINTGSGVLITISRELTGFPLPPALQEHPLLVERQELIWAAAQAAEEGGYTLATELLPEERDPALWLDRINAIYPFTYNAGHLYPNDPRPGMAALTDSVSRGLGIHIDYYVLVDFAGFVDLVDALGGVTVTSRETMDIRMSPAKEGEEDLILHITPGRHTLDGRSALVYVRNRTDTSDIVRTRRQRCFVREVVAQVQASTIVSRFDRIAGAIRRYAATDIPVSVLPDLIQVVAELDRSDIATMAIQPGYLAEKINYRGLPIIDIPRTQAAVRNVIRGLETGAPTIDGSECGN